MAGVKGRSGGSRPNTGGARPNSGRKPKTPRAALSIPDAAGSPLAFLTSVMNDKEQDPRLRVRAAVAAAQYVHVKLGDAGKKDERRKAAEKAAAGKFAASDAPRLVVNNK